MDYGVDPEGTEDGEPHTVRVDVVEVAALNREDRASLRCVPADDGRCEQEDVEEGTLVFRWRPGTEEEEPGSYSWMLVRAEELVLVAYEGSGQFSEDPRGLELPIESDDLRAAALDPAMGLRTTADALAAGEELENYEGEEEPDPA